MVTTHKIKFTIIQKKTKGPYCANALANCYKYQQLKTHQFHFLWRVLGTVRYFFKNNSIHKLCISTSSNILLLDTELCAPKSETNLKLGILKLGTLYQPIKNFWLSYIKLLTYIYTIFSISKLSYCIPESFYQNVANF